MVMLVVLAGVLFFASAKGLALPVRDTHSHVAFMSVTRSSESGPPNSLIVLAASDTLASNLSSSLSEDVKGHHTDDGLSHLLAMFILVSLSVSLLTGRSILALYERTKTSSVCCLALERPG